MKVKVFSVNTTAGIMYGLKNAADNQVLYTANAKWKTAKGAQRYAQKHGYELVS